MSQLLRRAFFAGLVGLVLAPVAFADPGAEAGHACAADNRQQAAVLADQLFGRGEYQRAGVCYELAGDLTHANLAYLKASGSQGEDTARALKAQGDAAKALFASVGRALRKNH